MRLVLRDPPLLVLLAAIALNLPVRRVPREAWKKPEGWMSRRLARFIEWREAASNRSS
jgi:hypothetical protein